MHWKAPKFSKIVVGYESQSTSGSTFNGFKEENAVANPYMYDPVESLVTYEDIQGFMVWHESVGR